MSLQADVTQVPNVAIFCQNHPVYLEHAAKIGAKAPAQPITFRTSALWKSGQAALEAHGPRKIYFAPKDDPWIAYEATLEQVALHPEPNTPTTEALLANCLPETRDQGLWEQYGETVRTLYVISGCQKLPSPFAYTQLTKLSDGAPIDEGYSYGYVLVYEYCPRCEHSPCQGDCA